MTRGRPKHDDILTPREWEVAALLREGLTNEQIAVRLGISLAGAKYHVAEIMAKLEASSRQEAVARAFTVRRRRLFGVLPPFAATPLLRVGSLAVLVVAVLLSAYAISGTHIGSPAGGENYAVEPDLDLPPEELRAIYEEFPTDFERAVLLTLTKPQNLGSEADVVAGLRRVSSLGALQSYLEAMPETNVIVVDQSAASEVRGKGFLAPQVAAGRAIMELNVCFDEIHTDVATFIQASGMFFFNPALSPTGPQAVCDQSLPRSQPPYFGFRASTTPEDMEPFSAYSQASQALGRFLTMESEVFIQLLPITRGYLGVVLHRLDEGLNIDIVPFSCEEGVEAGVVSPNCPTP